MSSATSKDIKASSNGKEAVFGGVVTGIKQILDRKQNPMAFVTVEDREGQAEAILFSDVLEKSRSNVHDDGVVLLKGKIFDKIKKWIDVYDCIQRSVQGIEKIMKNIQEEYLDAFKDRQNVIEAYSMMKKLAE